MLLKFDVRDHLRRFDSGKYHSKMFKQESFTLETKVFQGAWELTFHRCSLCAFDSLLPSIYDKSLLIFRNINFCSYHLYVPIRDTTVQFYVDVTGVRP